MHAFRRNALWFAAVIGIAAIITALIAVTTAQAGQTSDVPRITARLDDLDPYSAAGAELLLVRLRNAADAVCRNPDGTLAARERLTLRQCEQGVIRPVVQRIDAAPLTALYRREFPATPANGDSDTIGWR